MFDSKVRLLVIDDNEADRLALRRCLQQAEISGEVDEAGSAADALRLMEGGSYDCAFLANYLPGVSGLTLFETLHASAPQMPVVVFAGRGGEDMPVELMKAGAADYLSKTSLTPDRVAASMRHAIQFARAIAAQKQAEEKLRQEESRFRTIANAIPQLAWMSDASGSRHWFNQRWFDYTGATFEEMQGWGWLKVHPPECADRVRQNVESRCRAGVAWEDTFLLRGKDNAFRWFLTRAVPIRDGVVEWVGTNIDVTDLKNETVERERLLAREHEARIAAELATKTRDYIMAIVAHDLRNPLQVITVAANRINSSKEQLTQYIEHIRRKSREMELLLADLLDASSIEAGTFTLHLTEVDLASLLGEAGEAFAINASERKISLRFDIDPSVDLLRGDRDRLRQVFNNLLGNAVKFTPEGGAISVRVIKRDDHVEIIIQDTGRGIAPENLPLLFDRFWKSEDSPRSGTGLGLPICKAIVEAHNGHIWVESQVGVGTTVHITIPCAM